MFGLGHRGRKGGGEVSGQVVTGVGGGYDREAGSPSVALPLQARHQQCHAHNRNSQRPVREGLTCCSRTTPALPSSPGTHPTTHTFRQPA